MATLDQLASATTIALDVENGREIVKDIGNIVDHVEKYKKRIAFIRKHNRRSCVMCDIRQARREFVEQVGPLL